MGDAALDSSSEDYEVIPDDAPHTVVPFQRYSRSCSPFSYLSRVLPGPFKRKNAEPPPQQPPQQQAEQQSGEGTDMVELEAVARKVRLKVQAKLGEPITTYNVVEGTKTPPGPGSTADYHIKVEVDKPKYKYVYIDVRSTPDTLKLTKVTPSPS